MGTLKGVVGGPSPGWEMLFISIKSYGHITSCFNLILAPVTNHKEAENDNASQAAFYYFFTALNEMNIFLLPCPLTPSISESDFLLHLLVLGSNSSLCSSLLFSLNYELRLAIVTVVLKDGRFCQAL